jgi:predicted Fe-Mo cluster-binding NifX family protein
MRVAISADTNNELESVVAHHFGRCPYFAIIDLEGREIIAIQVIDNPFYNGHQPGQVPGFIHQQNANVMLSGGMGGRAIQFFQQYGIETATGATGTVRQSLERYLGGDLAGAAPCKESVEHGHGE